MIRTTLILLISTAAMAAAFVSGPKRAFGLSRVVMHSAFGDGKDRFDMEELRQRIAQARNPLQDIFATDWKSRSRLREVHIIVFNPDTPQQGVHTIEYPSGSGCNFLLAFESKKGCEKFSAALKAQQFFDPTPQKVDLKALELTCESLGIFMQVVPESMEILPPTQSVKSLGHNPDLRGQQSQLEYFFDMSESDFEEQGVLLVEVDQHGSWE